jgi:hypothetical protein
MSRRSDRLRWSLPGPLDLGARCRNNGGLLQEMLTAIPLPDEVHAAAGDLGGFLGPVQRTVVSARHAGLRSDGMGTVSDDIGPCEPRKTETELSPEQAAAAAMVAEARQRGLELTGPRGLLKLFIKNVLEAALNEELTEHLGHEKNRAEPDRGSTNIRKGSRPKTVLSDAAGEVAIAAPRDRDGTFEPNIIKTRQRRLTDVDEIVLSLYATGGEEQRTQDQRGRQPIGLEVVQLDRRADPAGEHGLPSLVRGVRSWRRRARPSGANPGQADRFAYRTRQRTGPNCGCAARTFR